ncbi:MAG TPA: tetratricopeptide repeat protein, partial [Terriglobales bacterium]|nr:tetratricopeptide repeat protein [Terriglobales bacterium]
MTRIKLKEFAICLLLAAILCATAAGQAPPDLESMDSAASMQQMLANLDGAITVQSQAADELPLSADLNSANLNMERIFSRAQAGYIQDQITLARAYQLGRGVKPDPAEAAQWFLKAANFGSPMAQTEIGYLYIRGEGVARDEQQALKWFQRAAVEDYAPAQYDLAYLLTSG